MRSDAATVKEYLQELSHERRRAIGKVRKTIRANLPSGYEEVMNWGMITYQVPLVTYPDTYNGQPLMYAGLASQKNHMAVYLSAVYSDPQALGAFKKAYQATGKKLDMGKSCVRFKTLDDLPLEVIGETIASLNADEFVQLQKTLRAAR
jgi:uncharacterized protein YdhG (YjbR/CyaY superfamily)